MDLRNLTQCWLHSHEEDAGTDMVLRPDSHVFPPSRGRYGFEFQPDGKLLTTGPSRGDASQTGAGAWRLEGNTLTLDQPDGSAQRYELIEVCPDKLVVRPL